MLKKIVRVIQNAVRRIEKATRKWTWPAQSVPIQAVADLIRPRKELVAENALLRKQLVILNRQIRPKFSKTDRAVIVFLTRFTKSWRDAVLIIKPETILRWHRYGFRLFWRYKSRGGKKEPRVSKETIALIKQMAEENRLWGAERIRGELIKLGITLSKRTIQRYMQSVRRRPSGQRWATFVRNHADEIWACDFLHTHDLFFRPVFAFFIIELGRRKVIQVDVTRCPSREWVAQKLREATAWCKGPGFIIRDNDDKFGPEFDNVAKGTGIRVLKTPYKAPRANAYCERFLGSVCRECLDHCMILSEKQLLAILREYTEYYNELRPHQGIGQSIPEKKREHVRTSGNIFSIPVLNGLHHAYQRAA